MPTKIEKDRLTGRETTGHEWDGIKELNNPLPRWWLWVFLATIVWAIGYFVLFPAIPLATTYTKGLLGYSQRAVLEAEVAAAVERQAPFVDRIGETSLAGIAEDADLMTVALTGGEAAFADNCAPCHGLGGAGRPGGYPSLADDAWIWGGTLDEIQYTILHGIRNEDDQSRFSEMVNFGGFDILTRAEMETVAHYVLSLSGMEEDVAAETLTAGEEIYAAQCVACHLEGGVGDTAQGAPTLNDRIWLYGGTHAEIVAQIDNPQHGVMPPWDERLSPETIKMLTLYVHSLGGGE